MGVTDYFVFVTVGFISYLDDKFAFDPALRLRFQFTYLTAIYLRQFSNTFQQLIFFLI